MAAVKNFASAVQEWFKTDLSRFNFYLMPLSFVAPPSVTESVVLNKEEKSFLRYLRSLDDREADPNARYSVAVDIEVRFVRSKSASAAPVRVTTDPKAPAVRLTEEQIRERYPWDYRTLTEHCRQRYPGFKVNHAYHELRRKLESDPQVTHIRRLDPKSPKSPKKTFYSEAILQEFDKIYKTVGLSAQPGPLGDRTSA